MSLQNLNFLLSRFRLSGNATIYTPEIEVEPNETLALTVLVEQLGGTPSAASLTAKFQVAPVEYIGLNMNTDSTGVNLDRPWLDVTAGDGYLGHLLQDGAWPAALADQTIPIVNTYSYRAISRRLVVPPLTNIVRLALTTSFTGGSSPYFQVTVAASNDG